MKLQKKNKLKNEVTIEHNHPVIDPNTAQNLSTIKNEVKHSTVKFDPVRITSITQLTDKPSSLTDKRDPETLQRIDLSSLFNKRTLISTKSIVGR